MSTVGARPPPPLAYALPPPWYRRRHLRNYLLIVACAAVVLATAPVWWRTLWRRAQLLYWQRECIVSPPIHGSVSPKTVNPAWTLPVTMRSPQWTKLDGLIEPDRPFVVGSPSGNVLLVHERTRPDGTRRLIVVEVGDGYNGIVPPDAPEVATLFARVVVLGSLGREPHMAVGNARYAQLTKVGLRPGDLVLPGIVDATDPTHFNIPVRHGTNQVSIDGWLMDDDTVRFDPQWVWMR